MQHLITYAKDKTTGETRNIKDVESGLACNCVCGNCGGALEACKGKIRQHHFRHYSAAECKGAWESQLHLLSKAIIEEQKTIMLPPYQGKYLGYTAKVQKFDAVKSEVSQGDLQPDCLCKYTMPDGEERELWIEILNTHAVDEDKAQKIRERGITCVEIDVSKIFENDEILDKEVLTKFLLESDKDRQWINNEYTRKDEEAYNKEAESIAHQHSILRYIDETSKDEAKISHFCNVLFYYFMNGHDLDRESRAFLYEYIEFYKRRLKFRDDSEKRYFVSALQVLYCCVARNRNIRWRDGKPGEVRIFQYCFSRHLVIQDINGFANDIATFRRYIL